MWQCDGFSNKTWEHVIELENLEILQSWGSKPGVNCRGFAVEVTRRNVETMNCAPMTGEDGFRKAQTINVRLKTTPSSKISNANDFLTGEHGQYVDMNCF